MYLNELTLYSFRNYENTTLNFSKNMNVLYGDNGVGKTNILESIYMLGSGISFRNRFDKEIVKSGNDGYMLRGVFREDQNTYNTTIDVIYQNTNKKIFIDKKELKGRRDLIGRILYTLFLPNDTDLVLAEPKIRRDYFNMLISSLNKEYLDAIIKYTKLLKMRNAYLLKNPRDASIYNDDIAELSLYIAKENEHYIKLLSDEMNSIQESIFGENKKFLITYSNGIGANIKTKEDYIKKLESTIAEQVRMKTTFFGIHRSEYNLFMNNSLAKKYSSQGEKRLLSLMLKLASESMTKSITKKHPILLIDDAMLELDNEKRDKVLKYISSRGQVFITVTEREKLINFQNEAFFNIKEIIK